MKGRKEETGDIPFFAGKVTFLSMDVIYWLLCTPNKKCALVSP